MTPTFHDLDQAPRPPCPPPGEHDLHPPLPVPPVAWFGGQLYDLVRVPLDRWTEHQDERGLQVARLAWCGRLGFVAVMERRQP